MLQFDKRIYLTFDIDWAVDEIIGETVNLLNKEKIRATFFITHESPILDELTKNPNIDLGIHPNFFSNFENGKYEEPEEILDRLCKIVPNAVSIRSHALTQNSRLLDTFMKFNLSHDVNTFIPAYSKIELRPFYNINGLIRVPYFWEDDAHCIALQNRYETGWNVNTYLDLSGLKVFNFHPIHVFLNTEDMQRYETSRVCHRNINKLKEFIFNGTYGTREFLNNLIYESKNREIDFGFVKDIRV